MCVTANRTRYSIIVFDGRIFLFLFFYENKIHNWNIFISNADWVGEFFLLYIVQCEWHEKKRKIIITKKNPKSCEVHQNINIKQKKRSVHKYICMCLYLYSEFNVYAICRRRIFKLGESKLKKLYDFYGKLCIFAGINDFQWCKILCVCAECYWIFVKVYSLKLNLPQNQKKKVEKKNHTLTEIENLK